MLVSNKDALKRLDSPLNLMNRLAALGSNNKNNSSMSIFGNNSKPSVPSSYLDNDNESEIGTKFQSPFVKPTIIVAQQDNNGNQSLTAIQLPEKQEPKLDDLLDNVDAKVKLGIVHDNAIRLLGNTIDMMSTKLDDVKPEKLPAIAIAASKIVNDIRKERIDREKIIEKTEETVHLHLHAPQQRSESDYSSVTV